MSSEDEYELNYVKIDGKTEIKLLGADDYAAEMNYFFSTVTEYEQEKIAKKVIKDIEKNMPENTELFKFNVEFSKKFMKIINSNKKKNFNASVNRLLSIDFKNQFIFNYTNLFDVCCIIALFFSEIKKFKITSIDELKNRIKNINLQKYDFYKIYINQKTLKNTKEVNSFSIMNQSKSTDNSSMKDGKDCSDLESDENSFNKKMSEHFFEKNIKNNSVLNSENGYFREEEHKNVLTKDNFLYPSYNKTGSKDLKVSKNDLPIELIFLLIKLKEVKSLIFQIQNLQENFKKLTIIILSNLDWLFVKGIEEVKFDLGNDELQQELDKAFESRTDELYKKNGLMKTKIYYDGSYRARAVNCWEPEGDIFITENKEKKVSNEFVYNNQIVDDCIIYDEKYIYNIYNEFGDLTNIKYIIPVNYSAKNNLIINNSPSNTQPVAQKTSSGAIFYDEYDDFNKTIESFNESIDIFDIDNLDIFNRKNSLDDNNNQESNSQNNEFNNTNSTPFMLRNVSRKFQPHFKMILIYSYFFSKNLKHIKKLNLYFHSSYSYEMYLCFKTNLNFDLTHFLIFMSKIETLEEANFSFNSLDDKTFGYILGMLYKNTKMNKLRLSFFTPDINYYDNSLFNLCSEKKISLTKLFAEFDEYLKKNENNEEKKINDFIMEEKLLNSLELNFINLSNLLKLQLIKNLEELVFRFDIPLPIINKQSYINLLIKFIINLLIMLTFQQNKTHTVKILAPNLEINGNKIPYIKKFFRELSLTDDYNKYDELNKIEKEKMKNKNKKETLGKKKTFNEKEIKIKNEICELSNKSGETEQDIVTQIPQEKIDEYDIDINKNMENYDSSKRYKSMIQKSSTEKAANREKSSDSEKTENKSRKLNPNDSLENLVFQMRIYNIPEIFNFCVMNNLSGLKSINLGNLDEISFKGFLLDYKLNCDKLKNLKSIKIHLGISVLFFKDLEEYILEFININSTKLEEKFLFSNLIIDNEEDMKKLIELVYLKTDIQKLIVTLNYNNIGLLSKLLSTFINEYTSKHRTIINSLVFAMQHPKYKKLNALGMPKYLSEFIMLNKNKMILCNENPDHF